MRRIVSLSCVLFVLACLTAAEPAQAPGADKGTASNGLIGCVYAVADLVVPEAVSTIVLGGGLGSKVDRLGQPAALAKGLTGPDASEAGSGEAGALVNLIQSAIAPTTWQNRGGAGTVDYFAKGMSLVIRQTPAVHEQVADLLAGLRRAQATDVAFEVRVLRMNQDVHNRLLQDFGLVGEKQASTFLDFEQLRRFLAVVQEHPQSNVMQAPKTTVSNGQRASLDISRKHRFVTALEPVREKDQLAVVPKSETISEGFTLALRPAVSADRRSILVKFSAESTSLEPMVSMLPVITHVGAEMINNRPTAPITQHVQQPRVETMKVENSLRIPDGKTAVLTLGTKTQTGRNEYGPPVLSQLPYVNRLFTNVAYVTEVQVTLLLLTPRIVVAQEEEERKTGVRPPQVSGK